VGLKSVVKWDNIWTVLWLYQNVELGEGIFHLTLVKKLVFAHLLESHFLAILFRKINCWKTTRIYFVSNLEWRKLQYFLWFLFNRIFTWNILMDWHHYGFWLIFKFHDIGGIEVVFWLQKRVDIFLKRFFFWESLFFLQVMTEVQHLIQISDPFLANIFVDKLHIDLLFSQNQSDTIKMFPFIGLYLLDFFWFHLSERKLWGFVLIKLQMLSVKDQILSRGKAEEKRVWECDISTDSRWYLRLRLDEVLVTVLFDYDWGFFKHTVLTHFSGSYTDYWSEVFIFFFLEVNFFGEVSDLIIISKARIYNFEGSLVFEALKVDYFLFKWSYVLTSPACNLAFDMVSVLKLDFVGDLQVHVFWAIIISLISILLCRFKYYTTELFLSV